MAITWLKLHHDARTDEKLLSLSMSDHFVWFNLLLYASEQADRGRVESFNDAILARAVANGDVDMLRAALKKLTEFKIISCETDATDCNTESVATTVARRCITFLNFAKRQGENVACNGNTSTERSRKSRERKKLRGHATDATRCNTDATAVQRDATTDKDRDREREKRNTPLTPQGGKDDGGVSLSSQEDPTPLRSQRKSKASPEQVNDLIDWAKTVVGPRGEMEFYFQKLPGWACSYPIAWIETAVLCTAAKTDLRPGGMASYTNKCLTNWHPDGPPKDERATAARQRSSLERSTIPLEYVSDPEWEAEIQASYGRKAPKERDAGDALKFPAPQKKAANQ